MASPEQIAEIKKNMTYGEPFFSRILMEALRKFNLLRL
jgi:hypothetical protein